MYRLTTEILRFHSIPPFIFPLQSLLELKCLTCSFDFLRVPKLQGFHVSLNKEKVQLCQIEFILSSGGCKDMIWELHALWEDCNFNINLLIIFFWTAKIIYSEIFFDRYVIVISLILEIILYFIILS